MDVSHKLSADLASELDNSEGDDLLDVVVELKHHLPDGDETPSGEISAFKELFRRRAAPIEQLILSSGGEVLGGAWINSTLRARLPARAVSDVGAVDAVTAIDIPHRIELDAG